MTWVAAGVAAAGIVSNIAGGQRAAGTAKRARAVQMDYYNQGKNALSSGYEKARGYQQPWQDYGQNALKDFQTWGSDPNAITSDPSYKWRLGQGTEAVENSAAARGGLLSGNTGKALQDYGQNAASQEYGNEFNRWMQKLGIGQSASNNMSTLSSGEGNALAQLLSGQGSAYAGQTNQAGNQGNAAMGGLNNVMQSWMPSNFGGGSPGASSVTSTSYPGATGAYSGFNGFWG